MNRVMMTLDEAIKHAKEKADENRKYAKECKECKECAEEHEQLVKWLEELNILKLQRHLEREEVYVESYNKGVENFANWMYKRHLIDLTEYIAWWRDEISEAEPLKVGE